MFDPSNIVTFDSVIPTQLEWNWDGYVLKARLTSWIADGGTGKTSVSMNYAARLTNGSPNPPENRDDPYTDPATWNRPGYVIVISAEDDADNSLVHKLMDAGADLRYVIDLSHVDIDTATGSTTDTFQLPRDIPYLQRVIRYFSVPGNPLPEGKKVLPGGVVQVFIDPFMRISTIPVNGNQRLGSEILIPLEEVAKRTGTGILILHHFHKGSRSANAKRGNLIDYVGASKGFTDFIRCNIALLHDETDPDVVHMISLKTNVGKAQPVAFMVREGRIVWGQPLHTMSQRRDRLGKRVLAEITRAADAGDVAPTSVVLSAILDASHRDVMQALAQLAGASRVTCDRDGWSPAPALTA